jgi:hypothetical protein
MKTATLACIRSSPNCKNIQFNVLLAVRHLRTILSLILTNSEVRKLLSDFSVIGRDILAKGASKVAESLRPGEEELSRVDEAAPQDEFITKGGHKAGPSETPVPEVKVPGTDAVVEHHPRADDATVTTGDGSQISGKQIAGEGRAAVDDVKDNAKDKVSQAQNTVQEKADQARQQGCVVFSDTGVGAHSLHKERGRCWT